MKTRHLRLLTTLALLGFSVCILAAKPDRCEPWPQCRDSGGGSDGNTPQVIGVHGDAAIVGGTSAPLWAPTDSDPDCVLQKKSGKGLSGAFSRHDLCASLPEDGGAAILRDDIIIIVHRSNRGVVLGVEVQGQDYIGTDGLVHGSDVMLPVSVDSSPDGSMVIHVHADNVGLYQCDTHVLKHDSNCDVWAGDFALEDLRYSADP